VSDYFPSPLCHSLTSRAHVSGLPPSSSRRQRRLPKSSPIESLPSISSFLSWSTSRLFNPSSRTPLFPSRPLEAAMALVSTAAASTSPTRRH
jgi:hypothetical protein